MRLGIIGSGGVGQALAVAFTQQGHSVSLGTRRVEDDDLQAWSRSAGVRITSSSEVAAEAEVVFIATAWDGTENALDLAGVDNLTGKVLVDVTNPLTFTDRLELAVGHTDSGGEQVQRWAPGARVVKAFNTVGLELFGSPGVADGPATLFLAGDDTAAKSTVSELAAELGWAVHDCGELRAARYTEPLAMLWIEHAMRSGSRSHAFRLIGGQG